MAEDKNPPTLFPDVAKISPQNSWFFIQFSPFSDHLPCQTLPEEIFTQEEKSNNLPIESDSADVDTQTVEPLVHQTIDGKKIIYLFYPFATNMNWKIFLDICRYQCWKFRADSTRYHWCIISHSFFSNGSYPRKGTVFTSPFISLSTDLILLTRFPLLICRHLVL